MNVSILNLIFNEILECGVSILLKYMAEIAQQESNKAFNGSNLQCYFSAIWVKSTLFSPKQCKGSLRGRSVQGQQSRNLISNQPWGCCCGWCRGKGVAAEWQSPRFPPGPHFCVEGAGLFPLGYKYFSNVSITYGSSNNEEKGTLWMDFAFTALQRGELDPCGASFLLVPPSLWSPRGSPQLYHQHSRAQLLMHFSTLFSKMKPHPLFQKRTYVEGKKKKIKNLNWIKVWSLLLWLDPEVNLWDWSQGLQLFHLSLVVKEHRIWPIIYWEMHHWWWFLSFWIIFLENNWLLLLSEQVWKWEVYRWHTHNHKRFI